MRPTVPGIFGSRASDAQTLLHDVSMNQVLCTSRVPAATTPNPEFYAFLLFESECRGRCTHFVRELRVRWNPEVGRLAWDEEPIKSCETDQEALDWYIQRKISLAKSGFIYPCRWPSVLRVPAIAD